MIKDGTIIRKWSHNDIPTSDVLQGPLNKLPIGQLPTNKMGKTIAKVLLWFFLPLILLVFADRTWAWSKYVRRKIKANQESLRKEEEIIENKSNKILSTFKTKKHEKENCSR